MYTEISEKTAAKARASVEMENVSLFCECRSGTQLRRERNERSPPPCHAREGGCSQFKNYVIPLSDAKNTTGQEIKKPAPDGLPRRARTAAQIS